VLSAHSDDYQANGGAMDIREYVYSAQEGAMVTNVKCDLAQIGNQDILKIVQKEVAKILGKRQQWEIAWLWMSPDCTTYSRMDYMNQVHRDHTKQGHPPKAGTQGGKKASEADKLVKKLIKLAKEWRAEYPDMRVAMENPEGILQERQFMAQWLPKHKVHYCAYGHRYRKATNIWTDLAWKPSGTTGDGKCTENNRCGAGNYSLETGHFRHDKTLGQASHQEVGGPGRAAYKASVPQELHRELLHTLIQNRRDSRPKGKRQRKV